MRPLRLVLAVSLAACAPLAPSRPTGAPPAAPAQLGVLVMAHGGTPEWDHAIMESVAPVSRLAPTVVALGMADHAALTQALDSLDRMGVKRVAVVRLFISGDSFIDQTRYFLGLSQEVPSLFVGHAGHGAAATAPIDHGLDVATHARGLMGAVEVAEVVAERAAAHSREPRHESVLLIAHGMGALHENEAVLTAMREAARGVTAHGFARVEVATLREDWPEQRVEEEARIRSFVASESAAGRRVLVVPYRLHGFGPYAEVLEGMPYVAVDALVPHPAVTRWIEQTAAHIACEQGWDQPFAPCGSAP